MKIQNIKGLNEDAANRMKIRVDNLVKPQGSMGALEQIAIRLSGIYGSEKPEISKKAVIVMCADHGVCEEGIAAAPQIVTQIQSINIANGVSGVGALAKAFNADVFTIDIGIDMEGTPENLINRKIKRGSNNIAKGYAMSKTEVESAINVGIEAVETLKSKGYSLIATGEMGIGNTTPSTAILSVISGCTPVELTGIGANLPLEKLNHKASVIEKAIKCKPIDSTDPIDILSAIGGLDIAGLTGVILGAAIHGIPVVIDGYISTVAALLAVMINSSVSDYLFPSHASEEKSAALASSLLGVKPYLHLGMRLGEGSGAVMAFSIMEAACAMANHMITFEESGISVV